MNNPTTPQEEKDICRDVIQISEEVESGDNLSKFSQWIVARVDNVVEMVR